LAAIVGDFGAFCCSGSGQNAVRVDRLRLALPIRVVIETRNSSCVSPTALWVETFTKAAEAVAEEAEPGELFSE